MPFGLIYYYLYYPVKVMVVVLYAVICERQRAYHYGMFFVCFWSYFHVGLRTKNLKTYPLPYF